ncbi:MAG: HPP family protein [Planctomycetota bacterium JB042]
MLVRQLMSPSVRSLPVDGPVGEAFRLLRESGVRALPVVDEAGEVVGLLDERNVHELLGDRRLVVDLRVGEIMTAGVESVAPDLPLAHAIRSLREQRVGALPVVDGGRLVGLLSSEQMVGAFADLLEEAPVPA